MSKNPYTGQRDLEGVALFVILFTFVLGLVLGLGFLLVQDSNHETQCINAGKVYVDGNCLNSNTTVVAD